MEPAPTDAPTPAEGDEIVARAGRYYRWTRYLISIGLLIIYGSFFIKDGFFTYPRQLEEARVKEAQGRHDYVKPENEAAIQINRILGVAMPPLGLALLIWTLYNSRGQYRLSGHTLYVPGHPAIPLDSIVKIDKTLWDKKGVAYIAYSLSPPEGSPTNTTGNLKLDDFVYARGPTDAILERIEQIITPPVDESTATEAGVDLGAMTKETAT